MVCVCVSMRRGERCIALAAHPPPYLFPEGPVVSAGGVDLASPVLEHGMWGHSVLDLCEDVLKGEGSDGLCVKLHL